MSDNKIVRLVMSQGDLKHEKDIIEWYINEHFPLLLKFRGLKEAALYKELQENSEKVDLVASYTFANKKSLEEYQNSSILAEAFKETDEKWRNNEFNVINRIEMELIKRRK